ncbi:MAG: hypothetical protein CME63_01555 [Halobacteriovoraceae bacterium]|nr:hypothetical protein [Halobacteriovoraceae bacterium]|tara:strand:+ start:34013 stop:34414 length:402 start_codon:yes stop_codon:yes gene_type:complete
MIQVLNFIDEAMGKIKCKEDLNSTSDKHIDSNYFEITDFSLEPLTTHPGQVVTDIATFNVSIFNRVRNTRDFFEKFGQAQQVRVKVANPILAKKYGITNVELGSLVSDVIGEEETQRSFVFNVRLRINSEGIL